MGLGLGVERGFHSNQTLGRCSRSPCGNSGVESCSGALVCCVRGEASEAVVLEYHLPLAHEGTANHGTPGR